MAPLTDFTKKEQFKWMDTIEATFHLEMSRGTMEWTSIQGVSTLLALSQWTNMSLAGIEPGWGG